MFSKLIGQKRKLGVPDSKIIVRGKKFLKDWKGAITDIVEGIQRNENSCYKLLWETCDEYESDPPEGILEFFCEHQKDSAAWLFAFGCWQYTLNNDSLELVQDASVNGCLYAEFWLLEIQLVHGDYDDHKKFMESIISISKRGCSAAGALLADLYHEGSWDEFLVNRKKDLFRAVLFAEQHGSWMHNEEIRRINLIDLLRSLYIDLLSSGIWSPFTHILSPENKHQDIRNWMLIAKRTNIDRNIIMMIVHYIPT